MKRRNQWILASMLLSLGFLMVFLSYWLRNEYHRAFQQLATETDLIFISSIRELEDSLIRSRIVFHERDLPPENIAIKIQKKGLVTLSDEQHPEGISVWASTLDSHKHDTLIMKGGVDGEFRESGNLENEIQGTISLFLDTFHEGEDSTLAAVAGSHLVMENLLNQKLDEATKVSDLPLEFKILRNQQIDSLHYNLRSSHYVDIASQEKYALSIGEPKGYLLQKLLPQFAFAFLLLGSVAFAFGMSYKSLRKQQRLSEIKNDFISNVTHELKTPITTVGVAIEALRDFDAMQDPQRTEEYLNISSQELNRLSILVDKVLKMSAFEQQEMALKVQELDLELMLEGILASMKLQFEKFKAIVNLEQKGLNFQVQGDKIHLTNVIYNLLDNALKYSPEKPEIHINLSEEEDQIVLGIQDNGIGIEKAYVDKIFDRFFRVPTGSKHNVKGHGLGLSYVASVLEAHEGNIEVESTIGEGSYFRIYLPKHHG